MIIGNKNNRDLFLNLLERNLPGDISDMVYIEPFGGSFGLCNVIRKKYKLKKTIYNDITKYSFDINADIIHDIDFSELIDLYNNRESFFYLDPPYINKEHFYEYVFTKEDHIRLSNKVKEIKGKWLMSYQSNPLLKELYQDYYFDEYSGESKYRKNEIIIKNYK